MTKWTDLSNRNHVRMLRKSYLSSFSFHLDEREQLQFIAPSPWQHPWGPVLPFLILLFFAHSPLQSSEDSPELFEFGQDAFHHGHFFLNNVFTDECVDPHFKILRYLSGFPVQFTELVSLESETRSPPNWNDRIVSITCSFGFIFLLFYFITFFSSTSLWSS